MLLICTLFAPKKVKTGYWIWCFFVALVLMMHSKFVPNSTFRRCCSSIFVFIMMHAKYNSNLFQIAPTKKIGSKKCHKCAGTDMHKCLVGILLCMTPRDYCILWGKGEFLYILWFNTLQFSTKFCREFYYFLLALSSVD